MERVVVDSLRLPGLVVSLALMAATAGLAAASAIHELESTADGSDHWAFRPLHRPVVPRLPRPASRLTNAIDRFIAARLARENLSLSPPAGRAILSRRVAFTVTGLPPAPEDVDAFVHDGNPGAYERMVERYLSSPRYGERWGKHWLEVAGYADSNGYFSADSDRPLAWRYRDYVVRSLNRDKPFDQFVREQLA